MLRTVRLFTAATFVTLAWPLASDAVQAYSPEDQKKLDDLLSSAHRNQSIGEWAVRIGFLFLAVALISGAVSTYRKGLKVSESTRIEGAPAKVIAAVLVLAAVGLGVLGFVYASILLP
jgi:hypothetical protein